MKPAKMIVTTIVPNATLESIVPYLEVLGHNENAKELLYSNRTTIKQQDGMTTTFEFVKEDSEC